MREEKLTVAIEVVAKANGSPIMLPMSMPFRRYEFLPCSILGLLNDGE